MGGFFARVGLGSARAIQRAVQITAKAAKAGLAAAWRAVKKGAELFKNVAGAIRRGIQQRFGPSIQAARSRFQKIARDLVEDVPPLLDAFKEKFLDIANGVVDGFQGRVRRLMMAYDNNEIKRAIFERDMRKAILSSTLAGVLAGVKGAANLNEAAVARYKDIAAENLSFLERFLLKVDEVKKAKGNISSMLNRAANYATGIVRGFWDGHRMQVAAGWEFGKELAKVLAQPFLMAFMRQQGLVDFKSLLRSMKAFGAAMQSSQDASGEGFAPDDLVEIWTLAQRVSACSGRIPETHCQTCSAFHEMSRSSPQKSGTFPTPATGGTDCGICCGCTLTSMTYGDWQKAFAP